MNPNILGTYGASFGTLVQIYGDPFAAIQALFEFHVRNGRGMSTHTRELAAAHEAGHLLVEHILGLKIYRVRILLQKGTGRWFGYNDHESVAQFLVAGDRDLAIAFALVEIAGWTGEYVLGGVVDFGSSADEQLVARGVLEPLADLGKGDTDSWLRAVVAVSTKIQRDLLPWGQELQRRLARQHKLNRSAIENILRDAPIMGKQEAVDLVLWEMGVKR